MSILILTNGYKASLTGLGKIRGLRGLSEKRISKAVREELRKQFGMQNVRVSCAAKLFADGWHGCCEIGREALQFTIPI
jgi:hypothetical protein